MEMPQVCQQWVNEALKVVREHPEHEMSALRRREFYHLVKHGEHGHHFLTWLDILAAQHVLPIYETDCPAEIEKYDIAPDTLDTFLTENFDTSEYEYNQEFWSHSHQQLARRMIENAEAVLSGSMQRDFLAKLVGGYYHTAFEPFEWLFEDEGIYTPRAVMCALYSANAAVMTAVGYFPLDNLERFTRVGIATFNPDGEPSFIPNYARADTMSDMELGGEAGSDGIAAAMVATLTENQDVYLHTAEIEGAAPKIDLQAKLAFWEWWLTESILQAWQKATS
jgi:hypothetical protein